MSLHDASAEKPGWLFHEYQPVGVDLGTRESVAAYDHRQGTDPAADDALLDRLGVGHGTVLVDLACGTGSFVVQSARRGARAHGVDVGEEMLASAHRRASEIGIDAHWHRAGFLDYDHEGVPADVVTTKSALHQLPDLFKQEASSPPQRRASSNAGSTPPTAPTASPPAQVSSRVDRRRPRTRTACLRE